MATFRAIHPLVREEAFRFGFEPVPGDDYRVRHPRLEGKRAQALFYKAFEAARTKARTVVAGWKKSGTTILFPQVPETRWEAARRGVPWVEPKPTSASPGTIGDLIRDKLRIIKLGPDPITVASLATKMGQRGTDVLLRALGSPGFEGCHLHRPLSREQAEFLVTAYGFRVDPYMERPLPLPQATPPKPVFQARSAHFNGALDKDGCLVTFQITTTDDGTARKLLEALALGSR